MNAVSPRQWMTEQLKPDQALCLILDSEGESEVRQALLKNVTADQQCSVYSETPVNDLAHAGPFIFLIDLAGDEQIKQLLKAPERNWGWLASIRKGDLPALARHWRERVITGSRPHQALYRFHDNRVLSRALAHIPEEARPAYLGPALSVCYWQDGSWAVAHNPAPGEYPVPADPPWLGVPAPVNLWLSTLHCNIYRYLWAERSDELIRLSQRRDPSVWLMEQLSQALQWGWIGPQQVHLLVTCKLGEIEWPIIKNWAAQAGETPQAHFKRIAEEVHFWSGNNSA